MEPGRTTCLIGSYYRRLYAEFLFNSMTSVRKPLSAAATTAVPPTGGKSSAQAVHPQHQQLTLHRHFSLRERGERRRQPTDPVVSAAAMAPPPNPPPPPQSPQPHLALPVDGAVQAPAQPRAHSQARRPSVSSSNGGDSGVGMAAAGRSLQQFRSRHDYLYAMTEDLADWLNFLYDREITVDTFFAELDTGVLLCTHACQLQLAAEEYFASALATATHPHRHPLSLPKSAPKFRRDAQPGGFPARDNLAQFIAWCRQLGLPDCVLFETEDLVARKNTRNVVLCLLEVARAGATFGVEVPELVRFEREIDEQELSSCSSSSDSGLASPLTPCEPPAQRAKLPAKNGAAVAAPTVATAAAPLPAFKRRKARWECDLKSLDELFRKHNMIRELISECTCDKTFPMKRLEEGKYLFGDSQMLIFVRVLRNHVMVRVGGGWDSLDHLLVKHDPCRAANASKSGVPVHHQDMRLKRHQQQQQQQQQQLQQQQQQQQQLEQLEVERQSAEPVAASEKAAVQLDDSALMPPPPPPPPPPPLSRPQTPTAAAKQKQPQKATQPHLQVQQQQQQQLSAARRGSTTAATTPTKKVASAVTPRSPLMSPRRASLQPVSATKVKR